MASSVTSYEQLSACSTLAINKLTSDVAYCAHICKIQVLLSSNSGHKH